MDPNPFTGYQAVEVAARVLLDKYNRPIECTFQIGNQIWGSSESEIQFVDVTTDYRSPMPIPEPRKVLRKLIRK